GRGRGLGHLDLLGRVDDARKAGAHSEAIGFLDARRFVADESDVEHRSGLTKGLERPLDDDARGEVAPHGVDTDDRSCSVAAHGSVLWTPQVFFDASRVTISSPA